jgi:hypothetical protein
MARQQPMTRIEEILEAVFSVGPGRNYITRTPAELQLVELSAVELSEVT